MNEDPVVESVAAALYEWDQTVKHAVNAQLAGPNVWRREGHMYGQCPEAERPYWLALARHAVAAAEAVGT